MLARKWWDILSNDEQEHLTQLLTRLSIVRTDKVVYPPQDELFRAFDFFDPDNVKVVVIGQDPYHNAGQAHGLSFSVKPGVVLPPSLKNMLAELESDLKIGKINGDLTGWAQQGVLLLNTYLSVEENKPGSHARFGWEGFTDTIVKKLAETQENVVFVLWGKHAQEKEVLLSDKNGHLIIKSAHPSPLSAYRGFFGSRPFSQINVFLRNNNIEEIEWER